jgi:hypothetical protein
MTLPEPCPAGANLLAAPALAVWQLSRRDRATVSPALRNAGEVPGQEDAAGYASAPAAATVAEGALSPGHGQ